MVDISLPTPGVTPGPGWAEQVNAAISSTATALGSAIVNASLSGTTLTLTSEDGQTSTIELPEASGATDSGVAALVETGPLTTAALSAQIEAAASGESAPPIITTRTQRAINPQGLNAGGWSTNPTLYGSKIADASVTRRAGASSWKTVRTASSPSATIGQISYLGQVSASIGGSLPVTEGEMVTGSVSAWTDIEARARMTATFYNEANAIVGSVNIGDYAPTAPGDETRLIQTVTVPTGATKVAFAANTATLSGNAPTGAQSWFQDFLLETGEEAGAFFDGSFPAAGHATYAWDGTANASASIETTTTPGQGGEGGIIEPAQAGVRASARVLREWASAEAWEPLTITRDGSGLVTSATIQWPDGSTGAFTKTAGTDTVDAYTLTHADSSRIITQPAVTRGPDGAVTVKPALTVGAI